MVSNMDEMDARGIYFGFYVKRGEASENRIKEVKNMCFSDRLSDHGFWANFFRLLVSSLAYEMFLLLKKAIKRTKFEAAKKWQIGTIRASLLKVGATIKVTKNGILPVVKGLRAPGPVQGTGIAMTGRFPVGTWGTCAPKQKSGDIEHKKVVETGRAGNKPMILPLKVEGKNSPVPLLDRRSKNQWG